MRRLFVLLAILLAAEPALAQNGFTFQGRVREGGVLANGTCDLKARLYDAETFGNLVGCELVFAGLDTVPIENGLFTVHLDFTETLLPPCGLYDERDLFGGPRWLELEIA